MHHGDMALLRSEHECSRQSLRLASAPLPHLIAYATSTLQPNTFQPLKKHLVWRPLQNFILDWSYSILCKECSKWQPTESRLEQLRLVVVDPQRGCTSEFSKLLPKLT